MALGYEYHGLMAQTWDELRGDPSGRFDRDFYWHLIQQYGQPVLDAGCGTGRLLLDFMQAGVDIDGVDVSPEMLALCVEKGRRMNLSPRVVEQAVETLAMPRRYQTILASSSVLQLIVDVEAVRGAVARLHAHLLPGGVLVAPFMTLWRAGMPLQHEWENEQVRGEDGALLRRMGRVWYDPASECEHSEDMYQIVVDGEITAAEHHRRSPASRSYSQDQARQLFEYAGFEEIQIYRNLTFETAQDDDLLFTLVGIRAKRR